jgi:hypothetical protein
MDQSDITSVQLFRTSVSKFTRAYSDAESNDLLNTLEMVFAKQTFEECAQELQENFNVSSSDSIEILNDFIDELAQVYSLNATLKDPIIDLLLQSEFFHAQISFYAELNYAFQRIERNRLKRMLADHEDKQLESDLETVFTRMEHRRLKEKLKDYDSKKTLDKLSRLNSGLVAALSVEQSSTNDSQKIFNKTKFIMRIAAMVILIAIPAALVFNLRHVNPNYQSSYKKSANKKNNNSDSDSEKFDFDINLPSVNISNENVIVRQQEQFGFGTEEKNIQIEVIYSDNQLKYLGKRQTEIGEYVKRLELAKNNKSKNGTKKIKVEQEIEKAEKIINSMKIQISAIQKTDFTYQSTDSKIKVFISGKKLSGAIKAYELIEQGTIHYLNIQGKFYSYKQNQSGQLTLIDDSDKIEELNCMN